MLQAQGWSRHPFIQHHSSAPSRQAAKRLRCEFWAPAPALPLSSSATLGILFNNPQYLNFFLFIIDLMLSATKGCYKDRNKPGKYFTHRSCSKGRDVGHYLLIMTLTMLHNLALFHFHAHHLYHGIQPMELWRIPENPGCFRTPHLSSFFLPFMSLWKAVQTLWWSTCVMTVVHVAVCPQEVVDEVHGAGTPLELPWCKLRPNLIYQRS